MDTRLIHTPPLSGPENMAIDECLLHGADERQETTLRFYTWSEPTLSLGYFQEHADRLLDERLAALPLVRRASGGGAIVHHHELTYCFTAPRPASESLYRDFHETLIQLLCEFGAEAATWGAANRPAAEDEPFLCFERRSEHDIIVSQAKIVGSAQRRWRNATMQHGSILLRASPHAPQLEGIEQRITRDDAAAEIIERWPGLIAARLGVSFKQKELRDDESARADDIATNKFREQRWNEKR